MTNNASQPLPVLTDVLIIGAGAAGLMCAITAGQRGRSVLLLDHANKVGKKILMSGGGRCNFTNMYCTAENFLSQNPHFCKSALSRYQPQDFIALVDKHGIAYHEKKAGQLFCDDKARDILDMLLMENRRAGVVIRTHCQIESVVQEDNSYRVSSNLGTVVCQSLVVATGGLSIPKMGASGFGYTLAKQFGLALVETRAGLVPFTLNSRLLAQLDGLSGSSVEVLIACNGMAFRENLLFTHRGLSGPAVLQISSYWQAGDTLRINFFPDLDLLALLQEKQQSRPEVKLKTVLAKYMSKNMAQVLCQLWFAKEGFASMSMKSLNSRQLESIAGQFHCWSLKPSATEGYRTAEVTLGGIDSRELSSKTMETVRHKGLYFIGELVDVSGQLGGFNFQWAWASAVAAGGYV